LFRSPDLSFIVSALSADGRHLSTEDWRSVITITTVVLLYSSPMFFLFFLRRYKAVFVRNIHHHNYLRIFLYVCGLCILFTAGGISNDFIYFQF
jgi:hypothetical protein